MQVNGCKMGHINADTLAECLDKGVVCTAPASAGLQELVLMPGHHVMCVHAAMEPTWCTRGGTGRSLMSLSHPHRCSVTGTPSSEGWWLRARGPANGGTPLPAYAFLTDQRSRLSVGNLVLKCRYSRDFGSNPHAFDDCYAQPLRLSPAVQVEKQGKKRRRIVVESDEE